MRTAISAVRGRACRLTISATITLLAAPSSPAATGVPPQTGLPVMAQGSTSGTASTSAPPANVVFACRPDRAGNKLIFPYTITNHGSADVYVMDAVPTVDPATRQAVVDRHAVVIWLGADGFAHILKGIPPLPEDRDLYGHVIPLAARLAPEATLERSLEVPLPLAETSPYYPDLPLREYQLTDVQGVMLAVGFLRSTVDGFGAETAAGAADLYRVWGKDTLGQTELVSCAFPSRQLQILKRPDHFPRPD
jgi:hypothetical protein